MSLIEREWIREFLLIMLGRSAKTWQIGFD